MIDIQKEFDELTPENQEIIKTVISALSLLQISEEIAEAAQKLTKATQELAAARQKPKPDMGR